MKAAHVLPSCCTHYLAHSLLPPSSPGFPHVSEGHTNNTSECFLHTTLHPYYLTYFQQSIYLLRYLLLSAQISTEEAAARLQSLLPALSLPSYFGRTFKPIEQYHFDIPHVLCILPSICYGCRSSNERGSNRRAINELQLRLGDCQHFSTNVRALLASPRSKRSRGAFYIGVGSVVDVC